MGELKKNIVMEVEISYRDQDCLNQAVNISAVKLGIVILLESL